MLQLHLPGSLACQQHVALHTSKQDDTRGFAHTYPVVCLLVCSGVGCVQPSACDGGQGCPCRRAGALPGYGASATQQQSQHTQQQHQQQPQWVTLLLATPLTSACSNSVHVGDLH